MFLVELVMQGVRGIRELARLRFQSGFNFVAAGNEAGKTTAVDAMQRLLFPNSQAGAMEPLVSRYTPDASRGALVVCSDDGTYYRVIQDFSKRAVNLSKYNPASKEFNLLHKDWDNTTQFMAGLAAGISGEDYTRVFVFRREHGGDRFGPPAQSAFATPRASAPRPAASAPAKASAGQARLAELRETLRKAEEAADADYRYQSAKLALDEIRKKITTVDETSRKLSEIEASLAELKGCETLPGNLSELIEDHERRQGQKLTDAEDLSKELESLRAQLGEIPAVNFLTDKLFIAGALFGVLSILAGVFLLTAEHAQYLAVSVLLSLMLMAAAWYNGSRKNAQRRTVQKDVENLEEQRIELEKRFVHEGASITAFMRALGVDTAAELKEKAENYRYFLSLRDDAKEAWQRVVGDLTPEELQRQYSAQQAVAAELEQAARAVAQYAVDTYGIRQDIERLESESAPAEPAWDLGGMGHDDFTPPAADRGQGGLLAELGIASRIGGIEMETLVPAVEAAAQRNLFAITGGKYIRIELGHDGPPLVHAKDDSIVNFPELSHGTKALIYFCFRTGLVEALAGKRRLPLILDDALSGFDPARQQAACQILRTLGAKTQVVLFTSNPALKAAGDAVAELK
jgi:energy-coupling factor transporter ATP-binding protein EcfA2